MLRQTSTTLRRDVLVIRSMTGAAQGRCLRAPGEPSGQDQGTGVHHATPAAPSERFGALSHLSAGFLLVISLTHPLHPHQAERVVIIPDADCIVKQMVHGSWPRHVVAMCILRRTWSSVSSGDVATNEPEARHSGLANAPSGV